ncbi:2-C-methyl-D-erythritol 4-phosphate cytidylyltransferase [Kocuria sp. M1R5S2]|uniref:IspD/TarI family cytidylyltransferase n=1 Tax=Kocuria rhizosphaerae TaxID=3376285 RepID=UPI0037A50225
MAHEALPTPAVRHLRCAEQNRGPGLSGTLAVVPCSSAFNHLRPGSRPFTSSALRGRNVVAHTLSTLAGCPSVTDINVLTDERSRGEIEECLTGSLIGTRVLLLPTVPPGTEVRSLLAHSAHLAAEQGCTNVLVHRLTHALTSARLIGSVAEALESDNDVVVPAIPVVDSIKVVRDDGTGLISDAVDRDLVRTLQSPWGFSVEALRLVEDLPPVRTDGPWSGATSVRQSFVALAHGIAKHMGREVTVLPGEMQAIPMISLVDMIRAEIFHEGSAAFRKL